MGLGLFLFLSYHLPLCVCVLSTIIKRIGFKQESVRAHYDIRERGNEGTRERSTGTEHVSSSILTADYFAVVLSL